MLEGPAKSCAPFIGVGAPEPVEARGRGACLGSICLLTTLGLLARCLGVQTTKVRDNGGSGRSCAWLVVG